MQVPELNREQLKDFLIKNEFYADYYDHYTGRFFIPFRKVDEKETKCILLLIRNGYAMTVCRQIDGYDEDIYCLYSLDDDTQGCRELKSCRNLLYDLLHSKGVHYFKEKSFEEYTKYDSYQEAIDFVLGLSFHMSNWVDDYSLAMICDEKGYLKFIEVLEPCV